MENLSCVEMTASPLAAHTHTHAHTHTLSLTHAHIPLRLTAPTKPQCILGTIKETRDHRSGQRTQTEGERRRAREIEMDDREGEREEVDQRQASGD